MTLLGTLSLASGIISAVIFARGFFLSDEQIEKMSSPTWDGTTEYEALKKWLVQNRREAKFGLGFLVLGFVLQIVAAYF